MDCEAEETVKKDKSEKKTSKFKSVVSKSKPVFDPSTF